MTSTTSSKKSRSSPSSSTPNILGIKNADYVYENVLAVATPLGECSLADRMGRREPADRGHPRHHRAAATRTGLRTRTRRDAHGHQAREHHLLSPTTTSNWATLALARFGSKTTKTSSPGGTLGYMAPELAMGHPAPKSDVFAVGVPAVRTAGRRASRVAVHMAAPRNRNHWQEGPRTGGAGRTSPTPGSDRHSSGARSIPTAIDTHMQVPCSTRFCLSKSGLWRAWPMPPSRCDTIRPVFEATNQELTLIDLVDGQFWTWCVDVADLEPDEFPEDKYNALLQVFFDAWRMGASRKEAPTPDKLRSVMLKDARIVSLRGQRRVVGHARRTDLPCSRTRLFRRLEGRPNRHQRGPRSRRPQLKRTAKWQNDRLAAPSPSRGSPTNASRTTATRRASRSAATFEEIIAEKLDAAGVPVPTVLKPP